MCEFCASHGGKTRWYLNPKNFSPELLEDKKRMKVLHDITGYGIDYYIDRVTSLAKLTRIPLLGHVLKGLGNRIAAGRHSGQIVTTEEATQLLKLADNVCVLDCMCRRLVHGEKKAMCINFGPIKELFEIMKPSEVIEVRPIDEVADLIRDSTSQGLYHQVLWAKIPYPVAICNCQKEYCNSFKIRSLYNVQSSLYKGHYVSSVSEKCDGCEGKPQAICVEKCPFKAITFNSVERKAESDQTQCFGCGICKNLCPKGAVTLISRDSIPKIKKLW